MNIHLPAILMVTRGIQGYRVRLLTHSHSHIKAQKREAMISSALKPIGWVKVMGRAQILDPARPRILIPSQTKTKVGLSENVRLIFPMK